jgi:hypothetical protein
MATATAEGRDDGEQRFLRRLEELLPFDVVDVVLDRPQLIAYVDVIDPEHGCVLRTIRVDYERMSVAGGDDPTMQLNRPLEESSGDRLQRRSLGTPAECAEVAAAWIVEQCGRPIDRSEWDGDGHGWLLWSLADTERPLVFRYADRPRRPPDRVVRIQATCGR